MSNRPECPHCGAALGSIPCCEADRAERTKRLSEFQAEQAEHRSILKTLGIEISEVPASSTRDTGIWRVVPQSDALWRFLRECAALRSGPGAATPAP